MLTYIKQLFSFLDGRTRLKLVGLLVLMALSSLFEMLGIGIFLPLLQSLSGSDAGTNQMYDYLDMMGIGGQWIRDSGITGLSLLILFILLIKHVVILVTTYAQNKLTIMLNVKISALTLEGYMRLPYAALSRRNPAEVIRTLQDSCLYAFEVGLNGILTIMLELFSGLAIVCYLLYLSPEITVATVGTMGVAFVLYNVAVRDKLITWGAGGHETMAAALKWVSQALGAVKEAKLHRLESFFADHYKNQIYLRAGYRIRVMITRALPRPLFEIFVVSGMLGFIALKASEGQAEDMMPILGVFAMAAFRLLPSFNKISVSLADVRVSTVPVAHLFSETAIITQTAMPAELFRSPKKRSVFQNKISLENITYRYEGAGVAAVEGLNLSIAAGERVGIAGPSGAGKSTAIDIILGILKPTEGRMLVDGQVLEANTSFWQGQIGYVPQSVYLIDDTLRRNIAFGLSDAEIDDERVLRVIEMVKLTDFLATLNGGLDEIMGERGARLSGGQRQRVSIARALYLEPSLLIFDEATSALDNESEATISRVIQELALQMTVVIVAHRLNTIRDCDKIIFMEEGNVVESGTFDELMTSCQPFRRQVTLMNGT